MARRRTTEADADDLPRYFVWVRGLEDTERSEAVETRHLTVQKHDVEALLFGKLDRRGSIRSLFGLKLAPAGLQHLANDRAHRR